VQYLLRLCELELIERERRMIERRIKAAKFPATKSLAVNRGDKLVSGNGRLV
jgi:DNA replication protein DnaC